MDKGHCGWKYILRVFRICDPDRPPAGTLPDTTEEETPTDTATKSDAEKVKKIVMLDPANQAVVNAERSRSDRIPM